MANKKYRIRLPDNTKKLNCQYYSCSFAWRCRRLVVPTPAGPGPPSPWPGPSEPMRWLHAMLRLTNARHDQEQLRRVCRSFLMLTGTGLDAKDIMADADAEESDYLRAWLRGVRQRESLLSPSAMTFLSQWVHADLSTGWISGPLSKTASDNEPMEYQVERDAWNSLVNEIAGLGVREQMTLNELLQELDLRSKMPRPPWMPYPASPYMPQRVWSSIMSI